MMTNKKWYESKTVLAAVFTAAVAVLGAILGEAHWAVVAIVAAGSAIGIYGRGAATSTIKW